MKKTLHSLGMAIIFPLFFIACSKESAGPTPTPVVDVCPNMPGVQTDPALCPASSPATVAASSPATTNPVWNGDPATVTVNPANSNEITIKKDGIIFTPPGVDVSKTFTITLNLLANTLLEISVKNTVNGTTANCSLLLKAYSPVRTNVCRDVSWYLYESKARQVYPVIGPWTYYSPGCDVSTFYPGNYPGDTCLTILGPCNGSLSGTVQRTHWSLLNNDQSFTWDGTWRIRESTQDILWVEQTVLAFNGTDSVYASKIYHRKL